MGSKSKSRSARTSHHSEAFDEPYRHAHAIPIIETVVVSVLLILLMGGYLTLALLAG